MPGRSGTVSGILVLMVSGSRRLPWFEEQGKNRPILLEVRELEERGLASLRVTRLGIPNILAAARYLEGAVAGSEPLDAVTVLLDRLLDPDDDTWVRGDDYRAAASELLGHDDETFGKPLKTRRAAAAGRLCQSAETFRRDDRGGQEAQTLLAVCAAIETVIKQGREREATALAEALKRRGAVRSLPYVHRPDLERSLACLMEARPPVIAVAGPPSTGKRVLVAQVLADLGIVSVVIIDGSDPEVARHGMVEALHDRGTPYREIGALPQYQLRDLVESDKGPDYLVIENVGDAGWLDFFTTDRTRATIIVTTTRHLRAVDQGHQVEVGAMEPDEAVELIRALIPTAPEQDASELARLLDHQVLAITAACGMIRQSADGSIPGFCRNLTLNMAAVFDGELSPPSRRDQPALTQIYRETLADLQREDPQALVALELAAFLAEDTAPSAFVVLGLASALGIDPDDKAHLAAIAQRAVNALRNRYLVSVDDHSALSVPTVARRIISHLVHDRGSEIRGHLRNGLLTAISFSRENAPDMPLMDFVRMHTATLFNLTHTYIDPKKKNRYFMGYVYFYAGALTELLKAIRVPAWRVAIIVFESSLQSYSVTLMELPEKMAHVARPALTISWNDPERHHLEREIKNWETRKVMQVILVDRSGAASRDLRTLPRTE